METEDINVINPSGELVSLPPDQVQEALQSGSGYREATPEDLSDYKNNTLGQKAGALAEGAASAATFGASTGIESAAGNAFDIDSLKPEAIQERREAHPGYNMAGQAIGLAASAAIPGLGAANLLEDVGRGAQTLAGIGEATTAAKIGSAAVKAAAENAAFQVGDEISKAFSGHPEVNPLEAVQTAAVNVGLAALIGGGLGAGVGAANPIWDATAGPKLQEFLSTLTNKVNGMPISNTVGEALEKTGITADPAVMAGLSDSPKLNQDFLHLAQSPSAAGRETEASLSNFRKSAAETALNAMGKTEEDLGALKTLDKYGAGEKIQADLSKNFKERLKGPVADFEKIQDELGPSVLETTDKSLLQEKLGEMSIDSGFHKMPGSAENKFMDRVLGYIPLQENLGDLMKLRSNLLNEVYNSQELRGSGLYGKLKTIFNSAEEGLIDRASMGKGEEFVSRLSQARTAYKEFMNDADEVAERLKPGKYRNASSFVRALEDAKPELFIDRLNGKNDAGWLQYASQNHPNVAQGLKDYQISKLVKIAAASGKNGEVISAEKLIKGINTLTAENPTLKGFLVPEGSIEKLDGVATLLGKLNELKWNYSNTTPTGAGMFKHVPGAALAMVSMLTGHSPLLSGIVGATTHFVGREVPDAIKLAMLKFSASSQPINSGAFKAMVDFIQHTIKGENLVAKASKAIFKAGSEVLPQAVIPSRKDTDKLDKRLMELKGNPNPLMKIGGQTGHYLPDHAQAMGQTGAQAVNYLNSIRPSTDKKSPLDTEIKPSKDLEAAFHNALEIAQQPLLTLDKMKQGTLTTQDLMHLNSMYPQLYQKLQQKLTNEMVNALTKEVTIPYKTRMGLSLFMGQPLDSTMLPQSILATQPKMPGQSQFAQAQSRQQHSTNSLSKMPGMYQSSAQAAESRRMK